MYTPPDALEVDKTGYKTKHLRNENNCTYPCPIFTIFVYIWVGSSSLHISLSLTNTSSSFIDGFLAIRRLVVEALPIVPPLLEEPDLLLFGTLSISFSLGRLEIGDFVAVLGECMDSSMVEIGLSVLRLPQDMAIFSRDGGVGSNADVLKDGFPTYSTGADGTFVSMRSR